MAIQKLLLPYNFTRFDQKALDVENGFADDLVHTIFQPRKKEVASEIIDIATNHKFDIIVISHKPGNATRFFYRKQKNWKY